MYVGTCGCPWAWAKVPTSSGPPGLCLKVPPTDPIWTMQRLDGRRKRALRIRPASGMNNLDCVAGAGGHSETGATDMAKHLAALGGEAVRTEGFPAWPISDRAEEDALRSVLRSGTWGRLGGTAVAEFERRFAAFQHAGHAVAVVNGTTALRIALLAAGIQAGEEVIVPPYTFVATASAVVEANAVPVFADIDAETLNLDPAAAEAAVTPRTRAVIAVHLGGMPADMDAVLAVAERHGLAVIEDAAHAHGAEYKGRRVGAIGHLGAFSFQSSKNLTCGEGGAVTTSDERLAAVCRSIHNCGRSRAGAWYEHNVIGGNHRMTEFQGALLNAQLDRLEDQCALRDRNGRHLAKRLREIPGIRPQPRDGNETRHAYHLFAMRYDESAFGVPRGTFLQALRAEGIPISAGYTVPLYRQPLFVDKAFGPYAAAAGVDFARVRCPVAERICTREGCWLSQNVLLGTIDDMDDIADAVRKLYDHRDELRTFAESRSAGDAE